jgi:hypothetical protein
MTVGSLRLPPTQKEAPLFLTPSADAFEPVVDENDYHQAISLRRPGTTDELRSKNLQEPALRGGAHRPPVDAFDPYFVLDADNYFRGSGLRGGRQLLAGSNSGSGSLSASTEDDTAMLSGAYLPLAWGMIVLGGLAMILYKKSDKSRVNAHRESTILHEDDEWLVFRD